MKPTQEQWVSVLDDLEAKWPADGWLPRLQMLIQTGGPVPDALGDRVRAMISKSQSVRRTATIEPMPTCPGPTADRMNTAIPPELLLSRELRNEAFEKLRSLALKGYADPRLRWLSTAVAAWEQEARMRGRWKDAATGLACRVRSMKSAREMTATEVRLAMGAIEYYEAVAFEDGRLP